MNIKELSCPDCHTELMEHPDGHCLDGWVYLAVFNKSPSECGPERVLPAFSSLHHRAWALMEEKVWELDPYATIHKDRIETENIPGADDSTKFIVGGTFPLRVCRAALWLTNLKEGK